MEWSIVGTGIVIGIAVAAPIGPINLLCIQRSLQLGFVAGLATGLGAVLGDGFFAAVSAFGIAWIADLVSDNQVWLQGVGGMALVIMGWKTMVLVPADAPAKLNRKWLHHGGL
ncbi:MAG: LysE family translocator, partial [Hyphomicrobiales bacterium]